MDAHILAALAAPPAGELRRSFDHRTLGRGRTYLAQGRVLEVVVVEEDESYLEVDAVVEGSGGTYQTSAVVLADARGAGVSTDCTCPVSRQCKHGAAVLLALCAATAAPPPAPAWSQPLDDVLGSLERAASGPGAATLAVEVSLGSGWPGSRRVLWVRPLRRGARGQWVRGGAGWPDVATLVRRDDVDHRQAEALEGLAALQPALSFYRGLAGGVDLADLGPGLWPVLRDAVDAGVALTAGAGLADVALAREPASVVLDAVRAGPGHRLAAVVRVDGTVHAADRVVLLDQAAGLGLLEPTDAGDRLLLAPLDRRLEPAVRRLLAATEPVVVPDEAAEDLLGDYLPRLRAHLEVTSSDGSVVVPEPAAPTLRLRVGWGRPGAVDLTWQWVYRLGRREHVVALDDDRGAAGLRRPDDEAVVLAAVLGPAPASPDGPGPLDALALLDADGTRPVAAARVTGAGLVDLVRDVLPALRDRGVEVVDDGEPLDYRGAAGEPEIRFEAAPPTEEADPDLPTDWLDLRVVVTVDGHDVALPRLLEAMTRGEPAVVLDDGLLVWTDDPALTRLAEAVRAAAELRSRPAGGPEDVPGAPDEAGSSLRVGQGDLGLWGALSELGVVDDQAARWVGAARALAGFDRLPEVDPPGLVTALRSYQRDGVRWLAFLRSCGLGGILADDMGLGKTVQALATISLARAEGAGPVLVVAPTSVVGTWVQEAARHVPHLDVRAVVAGQRRRGSRVTEVADGADVVVTSYTLLRLEVEQYAGLTWGALVLDEAHQAKNHRGKTYQAVRCLDADFRLALTGTPVENRLTEMWSLLSIVAPGLYPDVRTFTDAVARPVEKRGDADALARFRRRTRPFLLRRTKDLVAADLPPKQEQVLEVALAPAHRKVYDARLQRERQAILGLLEDFEENQVAVFAALTRLRQLSLHAGLLDDAHADLPSAKLDRLAEHVREVAAEGHRALVFSQFTRFLRLAEERLVAEGVECVYLDGKTRDRAATVASFREGDAPVFLISLKAGGVGLTLTEADYVFVLDPWWNPAVEAQAVDRAHRIGQTRPVLVYRLVAADTIEGKVMDLKARKAALVDGVLGEAAGLGEVMTADDVRAMLGG